MGIKKQPTVIDIEPAKGAAFTEAAKLKDEIGEELAPIVKSLPNLRITSDAEYQQADVMLGRVREMRRRWGGVWERIQSRTIQPIRQGLEELYSLNRDVDGGAEKAEQFIKGQMKSYQTKLLQAKREEDEARRREEERLRREADEKVRQAALAKTPQMRGKLQTQAAQLTTQAETVAQQQPEVELPRGDHSSTRVPKKPYVTDWKKLLLGIVAGQIPEDLVMVDPKKMRDYYREDPESVEVWPGVGIMDDVQIVGR